MLRYEPNAKKGYIIPYDVNMDEIFTKTDTIMTAIENGLNKQNTKRYILNLSPAVLAHKHREYILSVLVRPLFGQDLDVELVISHPGKWRQDVHDEVQLLQKVHEARIMSMLPSNKAFPMQMYRELKHMFSKCHGVTVRLIGNSALKKMGMNLILSIGESSVNKPCLVLVERKPKHTKKTVCICGKGVTFDAGGLAIKPAFDMYDMKFDKIGAVYGAYALRTLVDDPSLKGHGLIGVFPFADNVISESAVHPGDVIKSYSGKTVEITNPDAEGRLLLADALSYSARYKPDLIIDMATLTGAAEIVNCWQTAYYFASDQKLSKLVYDVGEATGERMNPMPQWTEYAKLLKSKVADLQSASINYNCDAFTAMLFLHEFVPKNTDWVHFDLSGAFADHVPTGKGIRCVVELVKRYVQRQN